MSALEEYEEVRHGEHDHDSLCSCADAAIESLKVCGNCGHLAWANDDFPDDEHYTFCGETEERSPSRIDIWAGDPCHFVPSRWQERRP